MKVGEWREAYNQPASRESGTSMYLNGIPQIVMELTDGIVSWN